MAIDHDEIVLALGRIESKLDAYNEKFESRIYALEKTVTVGNGQPSHERRITVIESVIAQVSDMIKAVERAKNRLLLACVGAVGLALAVVFYSHASEILAAFRRALGAH